MDEIDNTAIGVACGVIAGAAFFLGFVLGALAAWAMGAA